MPEAVDTNYPQKSNFKEPRDFTKTEISTIVQCFILNSIVLSAWRFFVCTSSRLASCSVRKMYG